MSIGVANRLVATQLTMPRSSERRRSRPCSISLTNIGQIAVGHDQRSTSAILALNQFMNSEVSTLRLR